MQQLGIMVLAAGASTRFDGVKQLAVYKQQTFVRHALTAALAVTKNVVVVLGAHEPKIREYLAGLENYIVTNSGWEEGMASSIRCGLGELQKNSTPDAVIIMVCDQPFVTPSLLHELAGTFARTTQPIVASGYHNTLGTPALFSKLFFPALLALRGHAGAKKIILDNGAHTAVVPFAYGEIDIDTPDDYEQLLKLAAE